MPMWGVLLICLIPMILFLYFGRKVVDQIYDSRPIICEFCGKTYTQINKVVNGTSFISCPHCGTRQ